MDGAQGGTGSEDEFHVLGLCSWIDGDITHPVLALCLLQCLSRNQLLTTAAEQSSTCSPKWTGQRLPPKSAAAPCSSLLFSLVLGDLDEAPSGPRLPESIQHLTGWSAPSKGSVNVC